MKPKVMVLIPKSRSVPRGISAQVFHRDFLGAHRSFTEIFSVRTDIPPEVVLCVLPEASCGQLLSADGSQEGTLRFPSGVRGTPTPMCTLRLAKL